MELTEVVSPSVAVPVLCVLVCAFLVFAFGFKSPAQPPSFDVFDEEAKRKRNRKSKSNKGQTNGHAVVGADGDGNESNSPKPQASPRQAAKQTTKTQNVGAKSKPAVQTAEQQKKVKKQSVKVEEAKESKPVVEETSQDDVDGWQTISKKDKKQKKKDNEKADPSADETPMKVEEGAAKAPSDEPLSSAPQPASPQEQRSKKKKDKKNKKQGKSDEAEVIEVAEAAAPLEASTIPEPKVEEVVPEPAEEAASSVELQIKDAMETTVEEAQNNKKKSKSKKKKSSPPPEDDFVIPKAAAEPEVVLTEESLTPSPSLPLSENTDALTVKSARKKHKKDRNKPIEEVQIEGRGSGASDSVSSVGNSSLSETVFSEPLRSEKTSDTPESEAESGGHQASGTDGSAVGPQAASFDEMGGMTESWTEAKPKSKKKKARRAD